MKRLLMISALVVAVATMSAPAFGASLLLEEFSASTTITGAGINLITASTADDNLNKWLGFRWTIESSGGDYFAQQNAIADGDQTNLMFYGFSAAGVAASTPLTLDFDYQIASRSGIAFVAGLNYGQNNLDPFAPWFNFDANPANWDVNDGVIVNRFDIPADSGPDDGWLHGQMAFTLPVAYDVLVVGFVMGGSTGFRAVDTVDFQSVPEPSTLLLLGSGLIGLVGYRRRKRMM